jgi:hypothetical protein
MPEMNVVGKPYEGKLHVRFDAAGDGKGFAGATYHSLTLQSRAGTEGTSTPLSASSKRALLPPKRVIPCAVWGILPISLKGTTVIISATAQINRATDMSNSEASFFAISLLTALRSCSMSQTNVFDAPILSPSSS